jgi:hypothetical protein
MKKALPFPLTNTTSGWISITDFHGGTMPICQPSGYKNTANGLFAVLAFRHLRMLVNGKSSKNNRNDNKNHRKFSGLSEFCFTIKHLFANKKGLKPNFVYCLTKI